MLARSMTWHVVKQFQASSLVLLKANKRAKIITKEKKRRKMWKMNWITRWTQCIFTNNQSICAYYPLTNLDLINIYVRIHACTHARMHVFLAFAFYLAFFVGWLLSKHWALEPPFNATLQNVYLNSISPCKRSEKHRHPKQFQVSPITIISIGTFFSFFLCVNKM